MDLMGIVSVVTTIVTVASLIAASTPTPKDDEWLSKAVQVCRPTSYLTLVRQNNNAGRS
jgi:hypothetical protein